MGSRTTSRPLEPHVPCLCWRICGAFVSSRFGLLSAAEDTLKKLGLESSVVEPNNVSPTVNGGNGETAQTAQSEMVQIQNQMNGVWNVRIRTIRNKNRVSHKSRRYW
jgi:hypothetical protein